MRARQSGDLEDKPTLMSLPPDPVNEPAVRTASPLRWVVVLLALVAVLAFLLLSPGGYLSKADMVGYAVCHRIHSHSFIMAGRQLPMCARCTGTFTGALVGLVGQALVLRRRRACEFPPAAILVVLVGFVLLMAVDGVNSYISLLPIGTSLYEPTNTLRLITGALNGLAMSAIVYPAINSTLWRDPTAERAIGAVMRPIDPVAGHVPGAVNRPYLENVGGDGRIRDAQALHDGFQGLMAGRDPGQVAVMCGSGVTACHHLLAMAHAGLPGAKLYTGSWSGWIEDPERPVATGA